MSDRISCRRRSEVKVLVAGKGSFICDECIAGEREYASWGVR